MNNKKNLQNVMNDFDKDVNYKKIMQKINNKQSFSYLKMALLPAMSIVFILSLILIPKFKINHLEGSKNYENNELPKFDVYGTFNDELSWAYNVGDTEQVAKRADIIIKIKVLGIGEGTFEYSVEYGNPYTPVYIETLAVYKGDKNTKVKQIMKPGGYVVMDEVIKNTRPESASKYGWNKLSEEERKNKYMYYELNGHFDFEIGKTYVVALHASINGEYYLSANGFNVFTIDVNSVANSRSNFTNILTGKELIINNIE